ncbi:MAG: DUF1553 domain-containing protein, partial [Planctomycetaceae bacterium]
LKPGTSVEPEWPFDELASEAVPAEFLRDPDDPRERFAAILTSPANERFAQVIVNRLWQRYLGRGLVEPVDNWFDAEPSHPELLDWLARELVRNGYDLKHVARLILNSETYQREVDASLRDGKSSDGVTGRLFASPSRRRMSAEQLVDSLFLVAGKPMRSEMLCLDPEGRRPITQFLNLGTPRRAWEFTSLSNERDRPSLSLPTAQSIVDVLTTFGWRQSRQNPLTIRDDAVTVLQPMILANETVGRRAVGLSDDSAFVELCLADRPLAELIEAVFLRVLSRPPSQEEAALFTDLLEDGYADRRVAGAKTQPPPPLTPRTAVSWANHFDPKASEIQLALAEAVREGDPPTARLRADWRARMEDMLWALVNSPEFVFVP